MPSNGADACSRDSAYQRAFQAAAEGRAQHRTAGSTDRRARPGSDAVPVIAVIPAIVVAVTVVVTVAIVVPTLVVPAVASALVSPLIELTVPLLVVLGVSNWSEHKG